jgi:hypothetical protein
VVKLYDKEFESIVIERDYKWTKEWKFLSTLRMWLLLETPVKKLTKPTEQKVYHQIVWA